VFPNITGITPDDRRLASHFLEEGGVAVLPGSSFGEAGRGYLRMSYANSLELIELALERMRAALPTFAA
jgi:aspartate/methionine/tyrosine aminotransferase